MAFDATGRLLLIYSALDKYLRKNGNSMKKFIYKILLEFDIPRKPVRLIKMSLTETYSRVRVDKNVSDKFPIRNGFKQGDALSPMLFNSALEYAIRRV